MMLSTFRCVCLYILAFTMPFSILEAAPQYDSDEDNKPPVAYNIFFPSDCDGAVCTGYFGHVDISRDFHFPVPASKVKKGVTLELKLGEHVAEFTIQKIKKNYLPHYHLLEVTSQKIRSVSRRPDGQDCFCCDLFWWCACNCELTGDLCACRANSASATNGYQ